MEGQGLILTIISDPAVEGAAQFQRAAEAAANAAAKLDGKLEGLDKELVENAKAFARSQAVADEVGKSFASMATTQTRAAQASRSGAFEAAKLQSALLGLGSSRVNSAIAGLGSLLTALPWVGVAAGVVAFGDSLYQLVAGVETTSTATRRLVSDLSFLEEAAASSAKAIADLDRARRDGLGQEAETAALARQRDALAAYVRELELAKQSTTATEFDLTKLAEAFSLRGTDLRRLEEIRDAFQKLQDSVRGDIFGPRASPTFLPDLAALQRQIREFQGVLPIDLNVLNRAVGRRPGPDDLQLTASIDRVIAAAKSRLERGKQELQEASANLISGATIGAEFAKLAEQIEREQQLLNVGNEERKVRLALMQAQGRLGRELTQGERELGEQLTASAALTDSLAEADRTLARWRAETAEATERRAEAERRANEQAQAYQRDLEQRIQLLQAEESARDRLRQTFELENAIRDLGLERGSKEVQALEERVRILNDLQEREKKARAEEEVANNVRLEAQRSLRQGADAVSATVERAIFEGGKAREILRSLYEDLSRFALRQAFSAGLNALFPTTPTTTTGNYVGGILPAAQPSATGRIIDEYSVFQRGSRFYSVAEGGANTPEAIMPLTRDSQGRLAVSAVGGGERPANITLSFPGVRSAREARAIRPTAAQALADARAQERRATRIGLRV